MNIEGIVKLIDAEVDRLERVRGLLVGEVSPSISVRPKRIRRVKDVAPEPEPVVTALVVTKVPAKLQREFRPRVKRAAPATALSSAPLARPVFVPMNKLVVPAPVVKQSHDGVDAAAMESAMRRKLLIIK